MNTSKNFRKSQKKPTRQFNQVGLPLMKTGKANALKQTSKRSSSSLTQGTASSYRRSKQSWSRSENCLIRLSKRNETKKIALDQRNVFSNACSSKHCWNMNVRKRTAICKRNDSTSTKKHKRPLLPEINLLRLLVTT